MSVLAIPVVYNTCFICLVITPMEHFLPHIDVKLIFFVHIRKFVHIWKSQKEEKMIWKLAFF